jgi:hypothetical protein
MSFSLSLLYPNSRDNDDIDTRPASMRIRCLIL